MQPITTHRFAADTDAPHDTCGIYLIVHIDTGRLYVGQTGGYGGRFFRHRCKEHHYNATAGKAQHVNSKFGRSVRKHGADTFLFCVLEVIDPAQPNAAFDEAERAWIAMLAATGIDGFNVHPAGPTPRGVKRSEETRRKMSESRKRMLAENPELAGQLRERLAARNQSEASKAKTRTMNADPAFQRRRVAALAASWSDPARAEVRRARVQVGWSDASRESARGRAKALMADPARRGALCKSVQCLATGRIFPSIKAAAEHHGMSPEGLGAHLNGRNRSFAGLQWRRVTALETQPTA